MTLVRAWTCFIPEKAAREGSIFGPGYVTATVTTRKGEGWSEEEHLIPFPHQLKLVRPKRFGEISPRRIRSTDFEDVIDSRATSFRAYPKGLPTSQWNTP